MNMRACVVTEIVDLPHYPAYQISSQDFKLNFNGFRLAIWRHFDGQVTLLEVDKVCQLVTLQHGHTVVKVPINHWVILYGSELRVYPNDVFNQCFSLTGIRPILRGH